MSVKIEPKRIMGRQGTTLCYAITPEVTETSGGIKLKIGAYKLYTPEGNQTDEKGKYYAEASIEEEISREEVEKEFMLLIKQEEVYLIERYIAAQETGEEEVKIKGLEGDIVLWGVIPVEGEIEIGYKEVYDAG